MKFAKKSLGQNFLIDKNIIKKILDLTKIKNKNIIEIGPGEGALTEEILNRNPKSLNIIEKDNKYTQKRITEEFNYLTKYYEKKSENGKKGAETRWHTTANGKTVAPTPIPIPIPKSPCKATIGNKSSPLLIDRPCCSAKMYSIAPKPKKKIFTTIKAPENQYMFFFASARLGQLKFFCIIS